MAPTRREVLARQEAGLDDLYRQVIIDHYRTPRHRGSLPSPTASHEGFNPLCGDEVTVDLLVNGGVIQDVAFSGAGCSISQSPPSLLTGARLGQPGAEGGSRLREFTAM